MNKALALFALIVTAALLAYAVLSDEPQASTKAPQPTQEPMQADATPIPASQASTERNSRGTAAVTAVPEDNIGSEGYGPHIQRIADEGDARQAFKAVEWISDCQRNDAVVETHYRIRADIPQQAQSAMTGFIEHLQLEARRCQTVTADIAALQLPLALRALQGKVPRAAVTYAQLMQGSPPAEHLALMTSQLEVDARAGSVIALQMLAQQGERFGLDADAAATYYAAYQAVDAAPKPYIGFGGIFRPKIEAPAHPGTSDDRAAKAIADKVLGEGQRIAQKFELP